MWGGSGDGAESFSLAGHSPAGGPETIAFWRSPPGARLTKEGRLKESSATKRCTLRSFRCKKIHDGWDGVCPHEETPGHRLVNSDHRKHQT
jgi:hypothetical protein